MNALFYPFHLCHERTLHQLLRTYQQVHFRDYMSLQFSDLAGMITISDRMGDTYPELLAAERIVHGHDVSGPMNPATKAAVNRDLVDPTWRLSFHESLKHDPQFQRGLLTFAQDSEGNSIGPADPDALTKLQQLHWKTESFEVETVKTLSSKRLSEDESVLCDYGLALIKTSVSLQYTIQLCQRLNLVAATDSAHHHRLLARTCQREGVSLANICINRQGY